MAHVKHHNAILNKVLIMLAVFLFAGIILAYALITYKENNQLIYELKDDVKIIDTFITSYDEYLSFIRKNSLSEDLSEQDFKNNYFLASTQEYDKCSEKKYKSLENIRVEDEKLIISFGVHNKCGFCKKKNVLYLLKIDKISLPINIQYEYLFENELSCGAI